MGPFNSGPMFDNLIPNSNQNIKNLHSYALGGKNVHPRKGKPFCRNQVLSPKALFLEKLAKDRKTILLFNFHQKFFKHSQRFMFFVLRRLS